jgi:hypothetical protein
MSRPPHRRGVPSKLPANVPKAFGSDIYFCSDPSCGAHIVGFDRDYKPICEMVLSPDHTLELIEICKAHLYDKATRRVK